MHRIWDCKSPWVKARKMHNDAPIEVYVGEGSWVEAEWENISTHQFVKSAIGIIPPQGYARRDNYSMHAMEWILLEEKNLQEKSGNKGLRIQHVQSDNGENKVLYRDKKNRQYHYHLDGYFVDQCSREHAYEFNGCWYHGCSCCFSRNRKALHVQGKSIQQHYIETIKKQEQLQDLGFEVHLIWSCDYLRERRMLGDDVPLPMEKCDPINIRDSYFGSRTNAIVLHSEFPQNSKGAYLDFCSLYPYVLKYERYPIGHPIRVTNDFFPLFKVH